MEIKQETEVREKIQAASVRLDLNNLSKTLDIVDVRILKQFYYPESTPLVFKFLHLKFVKYGWKKEMLRVRLRRLAKMGLIEIVPRTKPLCLLPIKGYEDRLKMLVIGMLGLYDLRK